MDVGQVTLSTVMPMPGMAPMLAGATLTPDKVAGRYLGTISFPDRGARQVTVTWNSDVVLGAASSGVSSTFIDKVTSAGVLQISPANTSTLFDTYKDRGLYFRTAPSDVLQGRVMAEQMLLRDGHQNVALLVRQDPYGVALAENIKKYFEEGGGQIVAQVNYDPAAATFTAEVDELAAADPDAIVLITFDEFLKIVPTMSDAGLL
jgi:ABC-type branched-subunit amino acid transport system substrate-binding protein